ncbi:MAG TPA: hypothetical protein VFK05_00130, partial [Polyangiaceae bacterium]|nr:hypothetical protein [Polyangiaceae bacterium]
GQLEEARATATAVLKLVEEARQKRGGAPSGDFWQDVTEAEARLLLGEAERALQLYHDARIAAQNEKGSISSTAKQVARLLGVLELSDINRNKLKAEFGI